MIVREGENEFILIEQHHHAQISGDIICQWKDSLFEGAAYRKSVEYAAAMHDCGWVPFDKAPLWNDQKQKPYTFIDFPMPLKTFLYQYGIDEVEKQDPYAALLCSRHYEGFLEHETDEESRGFVTAERERQERLKRSIGVQEAAVLDFHYALLQLGDNLSLYVCLNKPGAKKEEEHPFFRDGLPVSAFELFPKKHISIYWKDSTTVIMDHFPFTTPIHITLKQKAVSKAAVATKGLLQSYKETPIQEVDLKISAM
ncbi:DUF3891 family protein [Bacillus thermotolerans]|uniref:DUF3891 family protein n=1 Tax=Bacillus thermotolerans TaxID=1221996 RepID=UPI00057ECC16|nr:DUF3891 family protein [Bacillus thermotolerans]KKB36517.1 hypothetical protein QY97_00916 [Bacillus thermotolerans]